LKRFNPQKSAPTERFKVERPPKKALIAFFVSRYHLPEELTDEV